MMKLEIRSATLGYRGHAVLHGVDMELSAGRTICLIGRNGAGKTTLFKSALGILPALRGEILLDGRDVRRWKCRDYAQLVAYVPQARATPFPFTVFEVALFGRTARLPRFASPGKRDRQMVEECLEELQIAHLRDRVFTQLSGGEQQMTLIARALAQQPLFLLMDEPAASLDFGNQLRMIAQVNRLKNGSLGILMATHSPDHAFRCEADVMVVHRGKIWKSGDCNRIITRKVLREVYDAEVCVCSVKRKGKPGETFRTCVPVTN